MCNDDDNDDDNDANYNNDNNDDDDDDDVCFGDDVTTQCYDDFRTIWHLTRSQYGCQWFCWIVFGVENRHFFALRVRIFHPKFGLETGRRLCYEDLLLLEFLTM